MDRESMRYQLSLCVLAALSVGPGPKTNTKTREMARPDVAQQLVIIHVSTIIQTQDLLFNLIQPSLSIYTHTHTRTH